MHGSFVVGEEKNERTKKIPRLPARDEHEQRAHALNGIHAIGKVFKHCRATYLQVRCPQGSGEQERMGLGSLKKRGNRDIEKVEG